MALLLPKPKTKKKQASRSGDSKEDTQNSQVAKSVLNIDKTLMGFTGLLNKKQAKKFQTAQEEYEKKQLQLLKETNEGGKDKKTTKKWRKVVDLLFGGLKGFFKAIGKILSSLSLGKVTGLLGLLLGLFLMLKLGLLDVVLPAAIDMLVTLIKGIIGYLPMIFGFIWNLITTYIPLIINAIADALSDALGIKSKPLRTLVRILTWLVAAGVALNKVMGLFGKNILTLFKALRVFASFLVANPVVAIILAFVAALILIWKYSKQISDFFDGLVDKFKKAGPLGKTLMATLAISFALITSVIAVVVALAKLFESIKKNGIIGTLKMLSDKFVGLFETIEEKILGLPKPILAVIALLSMPIIGLVGAVKGLVKLLKLIKKEGLLKAFEKIWNSIKSFFENVVKNIIKKFQPIADFFTKMGTKISGFFSPIINKIKVLMATMGDVFGAIIDKIVYSIGTNPILKKFGLGIETPAKSYEEYRLLKYAEGQAGSAESSQRFEAYKKAKQSGNKAQLAEIASTMSASEQSLAESYATSGLRNLKEFTDKLNSSDHFRAVRTKVFITPVTNTAGNA